MSDFFQASAKFAQSSDFATLPFQLIFEVASAIVSPFVKIADGASQLLGMFV
ncbi:hypothetical protein [Corynebacterium striatum]|uniref:hypothetical protein n=1 Tax=Corynebacterium striatum TaxID=43770 RepID=UPI003B5C84C8